jgi:hypothetical protein
MTEKSSDALRCMRCPGPATGNEQYVPGVAEGCPGLTIVKHVGVVASIEERGKRVETSLGASERLCGRNTLGIAEAIGRPNTEHYIVRTEDTDDCHVITVAQGPALWLRKVYGPPPPGTPLASEAVEDFFLTGDQSEGGGSGSIINEVHGRLETAIHILGELVVSVLRAKGWDRKVQLNIEMDGTGNGHALSMQAAATAVHLALDGASVTLGKLREHIRTYQQVIMDN